MAYITDAFEEIAHSLRILMEAHVRAMSGLMKIDRDEAVGNIEHALTNALNAFASLCDAMAKEGLGKTPDWYATPELATVLLLRNARHHNHAKKIRTIYSHYIQEASEVGKPEEYVLANVPSADAHDGGQMFEVYQSWGDLSSLFSMPRKETKIYEETKSLVCEYMQAERFSVCAVEFSVDEKHIFFNVVPFLVNAGVTIAPYLKDHVTMRTSEGKSFLNMFTTVLGYADTTNPIFSVIPFLMPPQHE